MMGVSIGSVMEKKERNDVAPSTFAASSMSCETVFSAAWNTSTQKGVALQTNEAIRPIVKLRPYRTFQEVEQPESTFLIRISDRGISFIEADGGMWRLTARNTIKTFLEENLAAEIESGKVIVAL